MKSNIFKVIILLFLIFVPQTSFSQERNAKKYIKIITKQLGWQNTVNTFLVNTSKNKKISAIVSLTYGKEKFLHEIEFLPTEEKRIETSLNRKPPKIKIIKASFIE